MNDLKPLFLFCSIEDSPLLRLLDSKHDFKTVQATPFQKPQKQRDFSRNMPPVSAKGLAQFRLQKRGEIAGFSVPFGWGKSVRESSCFIEHPN